MPYFLTEDDFTLHIDAAELDKLIDGEATRLDSSMAIATDEVTSFLSGRYDLTATFAAAGDARNKLLVAYMVDIALYHLYSSVSPRNIPELRVKRYDDAISMFRGVNTGKRFLDLPLLAINDKQTYYLYGGNPKFDFGF